MRALIGEPRLVEELDAAYPWPEGHWSRACLVSSLDGCLSGADGVSGSISSSADRAVLAATRALADAYLVGAATVRGEGYRRVTSRADVARDRLRRNKDRAPTLAILSASCAFDWHSCDFQNSELPPLILTTSAAKAGDREAAQRNGCDVIFLPGERLDIRDAVAALHSRGLHHLNFEGGPSVFGQALHAGLIDEIDLTLAPSIVGAAPSSWAVGASPADFRLVHLLEDEGFLFTRYVRTGE
jgi:riboflavin biosynthesis pyrimidine reductase